MSDNTFAVSFAERFKNREYMRRKICYSEFHSSFVPFLASGNAAAVQKNAENFDVLSVAILICIKW